MVDGNVVGQAVVLSGFVLGNGAGTFSYHIFSDVEPQFATDPQSERSYGDERSPFKENIPGSWDSELGRQGFPRKKRWCLPVAPKKCWK